MPRTKLSAELDAKKAFIILIKSQGYALYGSCAKAAPHAGITQPTISRRLHDVDTFNIGELRGLRKALHIPKEEFLKALDGVL